MSVESQSVRSSHLPANHRSTLAAALGECRGAFWSVALFSGAVNLLMLAGPLYMLQVYDRVLVSGSVPTLVALSVFLVGAYAFQGILDLIRSRLVARSAALLDRRLGTVVHDAVARLAVRGSRPGEAGQPVRDLDQIRSFLTGSGPTAIVDLPWMPVFLAFCFIIHPVLGLVALAGGIVLFGLTLLTERASRPLAKHVARDGSLRSAMVEATRRNAETIAAMGMAPALAGRWAAANERYVATVERASDVVVSHGVLTKIVRLLLQSALLGVGAWLVILGELLPGAMIAASVMMGRALAPLETAIANWRGFVGARDSIGRLRDVLARTDVAGTATTLSPPARGLAVEHLTVPVPGSLRPAVANIHFDLSAGEALGVIGPSGAGKTCLARALVGVWPAMHGSVRLDGAALEQWGRDALGRHVGYVAQAVELFDGTVAENIARMQLPPDDAAVIRAANAAGAHDMILRLSNGYDTPIGEGGTVLSAGQRQRIALARALYGDPFLLVLDEPNANLDSEGEASLDRALRAAKERGAVAIVVAHRPSALAACDKVLVLAEGMQKAFGPRDAILRKVALKPVPPAAEQQPPRREAGMATPRRQGDSNLANRLKLVAGNLRAVGDKTTAGGG
jgi:PrtD family type I secretion system ABC transporter